MTQFFANPINKSLSALDTWTDIDLSSDIPANATGAIIRVHNTFTDWRKFGLRENGSTDNRYGEMEALDQGYHIVAVDSNRKIEGKIESVYVDFWLIGYTEADATLFTNGIDKSISTWDTWTDIDLSANLPVSAVAAIFEIQNNGTQPKMWSMRKKGSTDERYEDLCQDRCNTFIVGVDSNRKCQGKVEDPSADFFLMGYFTGGAAETNGIDRSLGTVDTFTDITESNAPNGATGAWVHYFTDQMTQKYAVRKNGSSDDIYRRPDARNTMLMVPIDSNKKWEGKIEWLGNDWFTLGYFSPGVNTETKASSIGLSIQETKTKASSIGLSISGTKQSSIGLNISDGVTKESSIGLSVSGYEDFTTFTEVDIGADRIQKTPQHIDHLAYRNETTYLYKDYSTDNFSDFEHKIKVKVASADQSAINECWMLTNDLGDSEALKDANKTFIRISVHKFSTLRIRLSEVSTGVDFFDQNDGGFSVGDWIYIKIVKTGTALTAYLYSDSSYSILVDTLNLTLHADHAFKYLYGCSSANSGYTDSMIIDIDNFNIAGLYIPPDSVTKESSIGLTAVSRKTKASSISLSIPETINKDSYVGLSVQETFTKASSIGLRIVIQETKESSIGLHILDTIAKVSSIGLSISGEGERVSVIGLRIVDNITKDSNIGLTVAGSTEKNSSIGVSVQEEITKASSISLSIVDIETKESSIGMQIVSHETKASSVSLTVFDTPIKNSSIGLKIANPVLKESTIGMQISGSNTIISSIGLTVYEAALKKGLFYAKLGDTILEAIEPESFRISEEINRIPSYEFEVANSEVNRAAIAANPTALLKIYWQHHGIENHIFTGIINADGIEYVSLTNIRITGFSSYVKLGWPIYKHLNSEDAEAVNKALDFHGTYTDRTEDANNPTINDTLVTFGSEDHCFYIGEANPFWGLQIKYSTPGIPADAVIIIEYSKGSGIWAELNALDETYAFTEPAGTYDFIIAHPPSDWARNTVDGISKFWIRWRVISGTYTTSPKLDQIHTVNVDVYRVFYLATSARAILLDVLSDTEYTMDAIDVCPEDEINIFAEYESPLRVIAAIPAALTWTDVDGSKKSYQWWIDDAKKVHIKQKRGTTYSDDITGDLTIFNNLLDYFNVSNRLIGFAKRDGLSQIRAIIEDKPSQATHALRELAVPKTDVGKYITLKESLEKDIAISKDPMQRLKGSVTTEFWGKRGYEVGDTVTLHQGEWVIEEGEFQIVKVDKGPILTQLNLGISREHLEGLKSNLKRAFDISNVQMHGSTTLLNFGPETMNYERISAEEVHSAKLEVEIPTDVTKLYKVLISWTLGNYVASVGPHTDEGGGHDHSGFAGSGGGVGSTFPGAGGDFIPEILADGGFIPSMLSKAHTHYLYDELHIQHSSGTFYEIASDYVQGLNHRHSGGSTGYPNSTANALIPPLYMGSACTSGRCVTGVYDASFATGSHYHQNSDTGYTSPNAWVETILRSYVQSINPTIIAEFTNIEDPAHLHEGVAESDHDHTGVYHGTHFDHLIPAILPHIDHQITTAIGFTMDLLYHIYETSGGTTMELLINSEKVAEYTTAQTEVRVDGYMTSGKNTIELQPIGIETNKKGGATIWGSGIAFTEPKKF